MTWHGNGTSFESSGRCWTTSSQAAANYAASSADVPMTPVKAGAIRQVQDRAGHGGCTDGWPPVPRRSRRSCRWWSTGLRGRRRIRPAREQARRPATRTRSRRCPRRSRARQTGPQFRRASRCRPAAPGIVWYTVKAPRRGALVASLQAGGDLDGAVVVVRVVRLSDTRSSAPRQTRTKAVAAWQAYQDGSFLIGVVRSSQSKNGPFRLTLLSARAPGDPARPSPTVRRRAVERQSGPRQRRRLVASDGARDDVPRQPHDAGTLPRARDLPAGRVFVRTTPSR